mmetsp:Transcript_33663/g.38270  ORF Transcript_33663/g.38270 Transcript_33663/m.38270 type:complete len:233 (-) Transcript_33663:215-913(-)
MSRQNLSSESFFQDLDKAKRMAKILENDINRREVMRQEGEKTAALNASIRNNMHQLQIQIDYLNRAARDFENSPQTYRITASEALSRKNAVMELESLMNGNIKTKNDEFTSGGGNVYGGNSSRAANEEEYKSMNNKQLLSQQKRQLADQDAHLDEINDVITNVGRTGQVINEELDLHNALLDDLHQGVDKTNRHIVKSQSKLQTVLEKSSNCCLILTVIIEIAAFICILLFV